MARAAFGDFALAFFRAGAAFGDFVLAVFVAGAAFGDSARADRKQNVANAYSKEYQL